MATRNIRYLILQKAFLLVPMLVYISIACFWHEAGINKITGDEPAYLMIADSIINDLDFNLINNYKNETPISREIGHIQDKHILDNGYSVHGIGLPLLLVPGYLLDGVLGAKINMACLIGLIPFIIYKLLKDVLKHECWSMIFAVLIGLSQPFLAASNQIYTDLLSGLILFYLLVCWKHMELESVSVLNWFDIMLLSFLISYLPWIHVKLLAASLIFFLFYVFRCIKFLKQHKFLAKRIIITISCFFFISIALLTWYNLIAFRNPVGPYSTSDASHDINRIVMIFLGLHIDRMQGLFFQAPHFLLGVIGLFAFAQKNKTLAVMAFLVYCSILVPNSAHTNWYGGFSFVGRFQWAIVLIWCFPFAYAIQYLYQKYSRWLSIVCVLGFILPQIIWARYALGIDQYMYNLPYEFYQSSDSAGAASWLISNPYAYALHLTLFQRIIFLPIFVDSQSYLVLFTNWVYIGLIVILIIYGYLVFIDKNRGSLMLLGIYTVFAIIGLATTHPYVSPLVLKAETLGSLTGTKQEGSILVDPNDTGFVMFGPYLKLDPGKYEITLSYQTSAFRGNPVKWDCFVHSNGRAEIIKTGDLPVSTLEHGIFVTTCDISYTSIFEFRVISEGGAEIRLTDLTIKWLY